MLADAVTPIGYAVKGSQLAEDLWRYKSGQPGGTAATERLTALLREFLDYHGDCAWASAGMPRPSRVAVVPSGQGRLGSHPLGRIVGACVDLPHVRMAVGPESLSRGREASTRWLRVRDDVAGQDILVIDDTWVSGGSAQSVAVKLKQAGAVRVAVVVLGRHVDPADPRSVAFVAALRDNSAAVSHVCLRATR